MSSSKLLFKAFPKQDEFTKAVFSGKYKYMLYGGAVRGGKTFLVLAILITLCKIFPGSRWAIVRKDLPTIRMNVLPSFNKIRPTNFIGEVNMTSWTATCRNGSEILFLPESSRHDPTLDKFQGLEVNGFVLEEASELRRDTFDKAVERAGSWIIPDAKMQPPLLILLTCNPGDNWVKKTFYDPWISGKLKPPYYFLPAKITDNPHVTAEYMESLRNLPDHLYRKFVEGDWTISDDPMQIVPYQDLRECLVEPEELSEILPDVGEESLGVDPGELGDDPTSIVHFRDHILYEVRSMLHRRTDEVADYLIPIIGERKILPEKIGVDAVGVGAGVYGNLVKAGLRVNRIMAGSKPVKLARGEADKAIELQFRDLSIQLWWQFRQDVQARSILVVNHARLVQDLTARRYLVRGDKTIECEPKKETKKRIGRSPNDGDAAVIANWVRRKPRITPVEVGGEKPEERGSGDMATTFIESIWSGYGAG